MDQIAVGCMDLDQVKTGGQGPLGSRFPSGDDLVNFPWLEFDRLLPALFERQGAGANWGLGAPTLVCAPCLAPCVGELDANGRTFCLNQPDHTGQRLYLPVVPQAQVPLADAPAWLNGRGLGEQQPTSTDSASQVVSHVPICRAPVALGRVHDHGGHYDTVTKLKSPQGQR